ncbi:MAG: aspartyl-phosphate phosphatase Spo0E family protein [Anaerobacillus sp.]|uniref:aspartyl-phosphate phosphatase Spo0E family protein n=1 Tax=Anaerobacillus sp. TaxID=1872506 RepID=UPI00391C9307
MQKYCESDVTLEDIEEARNRMIKLAYENPLSSQVVVDASTKLDRLLNVFYINQERQ